MIVRELEKVRGGDRHVRTPGWDSVRLLLQADGVGFSFHITTLYAGQELTMWYRHHIEAVYVVSGEGEIEDLAQRTTHALRPGVLYALDEHDRHVVRPITDIVCVCVFNPPVTGREVHDETGAYPSPADMAEARLD